MADGKFIIKLNKKGESYFILKAGNGQAIAQSEGYSTLAACKNGIESIRKIAADALIEDQTVAEIDKKANPKFEIYSDKAGEFRFRLKASNGEIIATGEGYTSKAGALNGVASIKKNALCAKLEEAQE